MSRAHLRDQVSSQLLEAHEMLLRVDQSWTHITMRWGELLNLEETQRERELRAQAALDLRGYITEPPPIKTLFLGGSGVGKSTLLNALAGRDISSTSALIRAHTSSLVIYTHHAWRDAQLTDLAPSWSEELCATSDRVEHSADALRDQWVIDAPDIDSTVLMHRARTLEALVEAEMPLFITSPQKYRDADCVRALRLIDARRPLVFVMTQLDEVWPEQRAELLCDLHQLSVELGLSHVHWVGLDASRDSIHAESEGVSDLLIDPRFEGRLSFGVDSLKSLITERRDEREVARLRSGYLAQRIGDMVASMSTPQRGVAEIHDLLASYHALHGALTPLIYDYLARVSRRQHDKEEAAPGELINQLTSLKQREVPIKVSPYRLWLLLAISAPLAWVWSWMLMSTRERASSRLSESNEQAAAFESVAALMKLQGRPKHDQTSETRETQKRAHEVLRSRGVVEAQPPLSLAQLATLGVQVMLVSIAVTGLVYWLIPLSISATLICWVSCYLIAALRALQQLQIRRGVESSRSPELQRAAQALTQRLIELRLEHHPRWPQLITSSAVTADSGSSYRQLLLDLSAHRHHVERLQERLDTLFTDHNGGH